MKNLSGLLVVIGLLLSGCGSETTPTETPPDVDVAAEPEPESNRGTIEVTLGEIQVSVNYGRPQLQGRDMISQLQAGQVWRLGMNEATALETTGALAFGETLIEAGRYSLWAKKVSADEWRLIFNSEADIWGTARKAENDLVEVPLEIAEGLEVVDNFTIELTPVSEDDVEMSLAWGTLGLKTTFSEGAAKGP
jgi:hypothetical protein